MSGSCAFDAGFDTGFSICVAETAQPDTRALRGVPSAVPRPRKRAAVREISGTGIIQVIGVGKLAGETALAGVLLVEVGGFGWLIAEAHRLLVAAIHVGAEAVLAGERALWEMVPVRFACEARLCGERAVAAVGAVAPFVAAVLRRERTVGGRLPVPSGGEAVLTGFDSDEQVVLMLLGLPSEIDA